jgi:hypothetical protein
MIGKGVVGVAGIFLPKGVKRGPDGLMIDIPYKRPSNATTQELRDCVQNKPCATCGKEADKMYADHKYLLVQEYYETGKIDTDRMRTKDALQPQCPSCSAQQGGYLSHYSRAIRELLGL